MGFVVSAILAVATAGDGTLPGRAVHYGRLGEGLVRSRFIREGMTVDQAEAALGRKPDRTLHVLSTWSVIYQYQALGVDVCCDVNVDVSKVRVLWVEWRCRPFRR